MGKNCQAPEAFPGLPKEISDFFGRTIDVIAEDFIFEDYVVDERVNEHDSIFPHTNFDGTQVFRDITGLNTQLFISFLVANNPGLNQRSLGILSQMKGGGIKNPDWAIDRKVKAEFEYYEVKPNSRGGLRDGQKKILALTAFLGTWNLPYQAGTNYNPDQTRNLWIDKKGFIETEVTLHWFKVQAGLVVYEVCIDRRARNPLPAPVAKAVNEVGKLVVIIGGLAGAAGGAPVPVP
jgi:hypothetical protein